MTEPRAVYANNAVSADIPSTPGAENAPATRWRALLAQWQLAFGQRDVETIAALFAEDALFQGLSPALLAGRDAIRGYYENVPPNVQAQVGEVSAMALTADTACGFAAVTFDVAGQAAKPVRLSMTVQRCNSGQWQIKTYHVSPLL